MQPDPRGLAKHALHGQWRGVAWRWCGGVWRGGAWQRVTCGAGDVIAHLPGPVEGAEQQAAPTPIAMTSPRG